MTWQPSCFEHVGERKIARAHHGDDFETGSEEIARGVRGDRDAVVERMQELAAAEAGARAGGEQYGDDRLLSGHVEADYTRSPGVMTGSHAMQRQRSTHVSVPFERSAI